MSVTAVYAGRPTPTGALEAWGWAYAWWTARRKEHHPGENNPQGKQRGVTFFIDADELGELLDALEPRDGLDGTRYLDRLVVDFRRAQEAFEAVPR